MAISVNDFGRNTFSPKDLVGRLLHCEKQRAIGLFFIDKAPYTPDRPKKWEEIHALSQMIYLQ